MSRKKKQKNSSGHHIQEYCPPDNIQPTKEIWLICMHFVHTRHYLSTTKIQNLAPTIPPLSTPTLRGANGTSARARRATGSTEPINDLAQAVGSSSRVTVSVRARQTPSALQGASQDSQPISISEDIFANIHYVQGDFVHRLIQNGALKFLQQTNKEGTLWTLAEFNVHHQVRNLTRNSPNASP